MFMTAAGAVLEKQTTTYDKIISPKSIVIVGASNNKSKPGGSITRNVRTNFSGELYLVNQNAEIIDGKPSYSGIEALPNGIDLAIIAIPAKGVYEAIGKLSAKDCKTVIVLTAGFGETDERGKAEEKRLVELADREGVTLIGPNVVGIVSHNYYGKFAGILPQLKKGSIDVVSASGATIDYVMEQADVRGLRFESVFSCGNSAQIGVEDVVQMLDEHYTEADARVKIIYMEGIKKPAKLLNHARSLTGKGCILIGIKSGVSDQGSRAAASHTGAMATSDTVVQALFDKAGIIRVRSKYELVEIGCALDCLRNRTGIRNVCAITDAGGPGVMLTDELNKYGLTLPRLKETTQKRLAEFLPTFASLGNPVDCLPTQTGAQIASVIKVLGEEHEEIDAVVVLTGNSMLSDKWDTYSEIIKAMEESPIPVLPVLSAVSTTQPLLERFKQAGKTYFVDEVKLGTALGQIRNRMPLYEPEAKLANYDRPRLAKLLDGRKGVLPPEACDELLDAAGLQRPHSIVIKDIAEIQGLAKDIRWPVVAKVIGPLHKSDVGGVIVGVSTEEALKAAWAKMSKIENFDGILIQQIVPGTEVILGAKREEGYGHLVMFGLGGIFTEVLKDSQFALAPLGLLESEALIRKIRSVKLLEGVRGQKGMSICVLADYLARLGQLVCDFPQISEVDFNPVKGEGQDLFVVDCRIIV
jgi:acyl-CoA synthetase (NDP forming)